MVDVHAAGCPPAPPLFLSGTAHRNPDDVRGYPRLTKRLQHAVTKAAAGKKHLAVITLSLNSFVPKPFTPFQWAPFLAVAELKERMKLVAREFHGVKAVRVHADLPKWAYDQALLARGDRRVADILLTAHAQGWTKAFRESPINPDFFTSENAGPTNSSPGTLSTTASPKPTSGKNTNGPWPAGKPRPASPKSAPAAGSAAGRGKNDLRGRGQGDEFSLPDP